MRVQDVESVCYACELADAEAWWNDHYSDEWDDDDEYEEAEEAEDECEQCCLRAATTPTTST